MTGMDKLLPIQLEPGKSIQNQIREMLVSGIINGRIPGGFRMPSSRKLAKDLGVSRNTVVFVYEGLVQDGYLLSRERQGYFVNEGRDATIDPSSRTENPNKESLEGPDWARRFRLRPADQPNINKPSNWWSYPYPFIYGQVDTSLFPIASWRDCSRRALDRGNLGAWITDAQDMDDPLLIQQIRENLLPRRGIYAAEDEILVTLGAQNALYLTASLLINKGSVVGMEEPGYSDARSIFALFTKRIKLIDVDEHGIVVDARLSGCDYVYVTPGHQYPTAVTLSMERRELLLRMAERERFLIIEDDYESEKNYIENPTGALKSLDRSNRVIYVGSFSKSTFPGLRLGYLVGPPEFIREARALRRCVLRHPPTVAQRTAALFLSLGHYSSWMRRQYNAYAERWRVMDGALGTHLPDWSRGPAHGGSSFWLEGPRRFDANKLAVEALGEGVFIEPGQACFGKSNPPSNFIRLGISSISVEKIEPGIERLAGCIGRMGA